MLLAEPHRTRAGSGSTDDRVAWVWKRKGVRAGQSLAVLQQRPVRVEVGIHQDTENTHAAGRVAGRGKLLLRTHDHVVPSAPRVRRLPQANTLEGVDSRPRALRSRGDRT